MSPRSRGLGPVSSCVLEFDMQGSTTSRTHNGLRGGLTSVSLHLYNTSYLAEGFLARKSGDVDKGITKDAKIQQTPHTFSFSAIQGPRLMTCSS